MTTELVVGFIPLLDAASLAVARELGFAEREGLALTLIRETSWANIRDRLIVGHFDAAHMLGTEPKALQLRYLQTLADLASEKTTTIVFPLPLDLIKPFLPER